jgi:hypothetical protein
MSFKQSPRSLQKIFEEVNLERIASPAISKNSSPMNLPYLDKNLFSVQATKTNNNHFYVKDDSKSYANLLELRNDHRDILKEIEQTPISKQKDYYSSPQVQSITDCCQINFYRSDY